MTGTPERSVATSGEADPHTDAALLARLAARDQGALREAIARHAALLNRIAFRMIGDRHEAEDIVQESLLRLWDQAPRLAARQDIRTRGWLIRVATNLAIDRLRAVRRVAGGEVPELIDHEPPADALIEANQRDHAARALIAGLPDRQRAAIVLTYYEELPNAAAAAALGLELKAFESLLFRARAALRKALGPTEDAVGGAG
jgi:RNA polymerase sigma factor (sigma-70 family)